jgi:predicted DNA-binding transcriptional regulator YafY
VKVHEGRTAIVRRLAYVLLYTARCRYRPRLEAIARGLGVSVRTVARDVAALEAAGWPMPMPRHWKH